MAPDGGLQPATIEGTRPREERMPPLRKGGSTAARIAFAVPGDGCRDRTPGETERTPGGEGATGPLKLFEKEPCSELGGLRQLKQTGCFPKNASFIWFTQLFLKHIPTRRHLR